MRDLQVDLDLVKSWFVEDSDADAVVMLIRPSEAVEESWLTDFTNAARRCYASDEFLDRRAAELGRPRADVLAARLPDRGAVMSGDFGEIFAFFLLGSLAHPDEVIGPKKWRLKQDRTKPAPQSDVVQFVLPDWPDSSESDRVVCAEVKTKATDGASTPISAAIADSTKDRLGRLAKTLAWLKERAIVGDLEPGMLELVDRFLEAVDHPHAAKQFWAIAVISTSLVESELTAAPEVAPDDCIVAVVAVPDLKSRYEQVFEAMLASVADVGGAQQ
jgi:hypothetical protein